MAKMRLKMAKRRPKMAKMRPQMAKMRPKRGKMRLKMAKMRLKMGNMEPIFSNFNQHLPSKAIFEGPPAQNGHFGHAQACMDTRAKSAGAAWVRQGPWDGRNAQRRFLP